MRAFLVVVAMSSATAYCPAPTTMAGMVGTYTASASIGGITTQLGQATVDGAGKLDVAIPGGTISGTMTCTANCATISYGPVTGTGSGLSVGGTTYAGALTWSNGCKTANLPIVIAAAGISSVDIVLINLPPASPPSAPEDPCFPSSATVTRADGTAARLDALKEGDAIVAATLDGALTIDTVSMLSIAKPEAEATFVTLETSAGPTLTVTPEHNLPVGATCCSTLQKAKEVVVGDAVWTVTDGAAVRATVTRKTLTIEDGLHSPVLTAGGFPVVDGVVTSFESIELVTLANYLLPALLTACQATGTCDLLKRTVFTQATGPAGSAVSAVDRVLPVAATAVSA